MRDNNYIQQAQNIISCERTKSFLFGIPEIKKQIYMLLKDSINRSLNTILTGSEQQKKFLKRKIRKDFYKVKQEMGLENYRLDDLRFCNK